ncbi:hypothetical protein Bhyg_09520, partial [Pseudolycoriella hygida]
MGVWGLETFIRNEVPNGVDYVNILEEIHNKKSEFPDRPVVLVFQLIDVLYNIMQHLSTVETICGPAFKQIHEIFVDRFEALKKSGAELHFFSIGPSYNNDLETWTQRQSEKYLTNIKIIDKIDANVPLEEIKDLLSSEGASPAEDLRAVCQMFGTLHVSLGPKYIVDVVDYANKNNALAILGNDSHFLIFSGEWRYWSCRDINLVKGEWTTIEFNKFALREYIGLTPQQMPMLATIAGNGFVQFDKVRLFHKRIEGEISDYRKYHYLKLAEYVQNIPNPLTDDGKRKFLKDLFGSKLSNELHYFETVRDSLCFYKLKMRVTQPVGGMDTLLKLSASISATYYNSLTGGTIRMKSPTFFDMRRTDFLPFTAIVLPVLKRQIGFIRHHMNDTNYIQLVHLKPSHSAPFRTIKVVPEYPKINPPDLLSILNKEKKSLNRLRFKILKWMIFGSYFHRQFSIEDIPKGSMVTVLAVMYLC